MMKQIALLTSLFVVLVQGQEEPLVQLTVFYEALCPDSMRWMKNQLRPTWDKFGGRYLVVDFIPFGHASFNVSNDGGWNFECDHGPFECESNMEQTCLLDKLSENALEIEAILCIMSDPFPPTATEPCMYSLSITEPSFDEVKACKDGMEGQVLLKQMGDITLAQLPPVDWVPWIKINGEFVEEDFAMTQSDLTTLLCSKYLLGVPECSEYQVFK